MWLLITEGHMSEKIDIEEVKDEVADLSTSSYQLLSSASSRHFEDSRLTTSQKNISGRPWVWYQRWGSGSGSEWILERVFRVSKPASAVSLVAISQDPRLTTSQTEISSQFGVHADWNPQPDCWLPGWDWFSLSWSDEVCGLESIESSSANNINQQTPVQRPLSATRQSHVNIENPKSHSQGLRHVSGILHLSTLDSPSWLDAKEFTLLLSWLLQICPVYVPNVGW